MEGLARLQSWREGKVKNIYYDEGEVGGVHIGPGHLS